MTTSRNIPSDLSNAGQDKHAAKPQLPGPSSDVGPVSTPEFKTWFGDSKIVDDSGQPRMVYQAVHEKFSEFSSGHLNVDELLRSTRFGFHFLDDKTVATHFSCETTGGGHILKAYLHIARPIDLTIQEIFNNQEQAAAIWEALSDEQLSSKQALERLNEEIDLGDVREMMESLDSPEAREVFERNGYDGVILPIGGGYMEYVAFSPEQIKLVGEVTESEIHKTLPEQSGQFILLIGKNWSFRVTSLAQAVDVYSRLRDHPEQNVRPFPEGRLLGSTALLRISRDGGLWNGEQPVSADARLLENATLPESLQWMATTNEEHPVGASARPRMG